MIKARQHSQNTKGPTEIRTRVAGIKIRSDNQLHYRTCFSEIGTNYIQKIFENVQQNESLLVSLFS
jgi:hypothetical protein